MGHEEALAMGSVTEAYFGQWRKGLIPGSSCGRAHIDRNVATAKGKTAGA